MKKVAFHNLGCKVNSYELDGILQMFQKRGYEIVDFAQKADIYIINTCTVTNIADRKSRQMIGRARAQNPEAVVVAAGCYVQIDPQKAVKDEDIDIAVGNNHKSEIVDIVEKYMNMHHGDDIGEYERKTLGGSTISDISKKCGYEDMEAGRTSGNTRAYIKIQDGCDQFCSYCAIPLARGRVRSRSLEDIAKEARTLSQNGYKEVVITGIHISSYGLNGAYNTFAAKDGTNTALLEAIHAVASVPGIERVRLSSLEPRLITDDFIGRLSEIEKVCPHFHLSLQSGCDSVLERMNRHYTTGEYRDKAELIRRYYEHPAITTDIIAGFPGETEEEFEKTRAFLDEVNLYECHVFKYSRRKGTRADTMDGQLTDAEKSARSTILIKESDRRKHDFMEYYKGRNVTVLTEDTQTVKGQVMTVGFTPEYVKVAIPETQSGRITEILCFEREFDIMLGSETQYLHKQEETTCRI